MPAPRRLRYLKIVIESLEALKAADDRLVDRNVVEFTRGGAQEANLPQVRRLYIMVSVPPLDLYGGILLLSLPSEELLTLFAPHVVQNSCANINYSEHSEGMSKAQCQCPRLMTDVDTWAHRLRCEGICT